MSIAELRQHTLSPYKLLGLLHKDNLYTGQSRKPELIQRKITFPNDEDNSDTRFGEMFLVPGGRYLVTESRDGELLNFRISVWDLSLDAKESSPVVATWDCDTNGTWAVSPSKLDGGEFLITVVMEMDTRFCILNFNPSLPAPKISSIASFRFDETLPICQYAFNDPLFIYFTDDFDILIVSNFREDLWGSYRPVVALNDPEVMLHGNIIIVCGRDSADRATFYGWNLSKLEPHLNYLNWMSSTDITQDITPLFVLTQDLPLYENLPLHFLGSIAPLDQWYTSDDASSPFTCDIVLDAEEMGELVCCVQLSVSATGRKIQELVFKALPIVGPMHAAFVTNCQLFNGHLLRTIPVNVGHGIQAQLIANPIGNSSSEPQLRRCNFAGLTEGGVDQDSAPFVFDYASGRSCVRHLDNRAIDILEFLLPPNTTT